MSAPLALSSANGVQPRHPLVLLSNDDELHTKLGLDASLTLRAVVLHDDATLYVNIHRQKMAASDGHWARSPYISIQCGRATGIHHARP
jgi:hypothetical protein